MVAWLGGPSVHDLVFGVPGCAFLVYDLVYFQGEAEGGDLREAAGEVGFEWDSAGAASG